MSVLKVLTDIITSDNVCLNLQNRRYSIYIGTEITTTIQLLNNESVMGQLGNRVKHGKWLESINDDQPWVTDDGYIPTKKYFCWKTQLCQM